MFRARFAYATLKSHLEDSHEEQHWAKDTVARAFSARFEDKMSNLILIGPKDCGKKEMIETISKFLHVPLLVIHDAHQLRAYASKIEMFVAERLLEYSSYDLEKASAGIVVLRNVNHLGVDVQRSIAGLMRGDGMSLTLREILQARCPAELRKETFHFRKLMFVATIECDIEGRIARRYVNDVIARAVNRENAVTTADVVKMNVCQELAELFNFIAPFHARYHQLLRTPFCRI